MVTVAPKILRFRACVEVKYVACFTSKQEFLATPDNIMGLMIYNILLFHFTAADYGYGWRELCPKVAMLWSGLENCTYVVRGYTRRGETTIWYWGTVPSQGGIRSLGCNGKR